MRDIIEQMEDAAERKLDEMTKGLPRGKYRCDCGAIEDFDTANPSPSNPYCSPICGKCFEELYPELLENQDV